MAEKPEEKGRATGLVIEVGALAYEVREMAGELFRSDGRDLLGEVDYVQNKIHLAADVPARMYFSVLWHETLHAACRQYSLEMDEDEVERLSHAVADLLVRNAALRAPRAEGLQGDA